MRQVSQGHEKTGRCCHKGTVQTIDLDILGDLPSMVLFTLRQTFEDRPTTLEVRRTTQASNIEIEHDMEVG